MITIMIMGSNSVDILGNNSNNAEVTIKLHVSKPKLIIKPNAYLKDSSTKVFISVNKQDSFLENKVRNISSSTCDEINIKLNNKTIGVK